MVGGGEYSCVVMIPLGHSYFNKPAFGDLCGFMTDILLMGTSEPNEELTDVLLLWTRTL